MFKSIINLTSAVADMTIIAAKEVTHQISSANDCCTDATHKVAWKTGMIRKHYEQRLAERRRKALAIEYKPLDVDK